MSEDKVVKVLAETVNAFHYFHEKGIIHRDIKPLNIFCRSIDDMNIIIGDFGISSDLDVEGGMSKKMTSTGSRTTGYAAPEIYGVAKDDNRSKILIGPEVDYYALGVTVFELLTGVNIFAGRSEMHIMRDTIQGRIIEDIITRPEVKNISPRMKKLIQGLLTVRHDKRWGFTEVSQWLAGKDVPVFENGPLRDFDPLKFGNRTLNSMEEIVAAIDSDRELAKKILMRAELEKWATRSGFDRLSDEITAIRESYINDDLKVSTLLYLLEPNLPCRIDGKTKLKDINDLIDILRREPDTMASLILEEKKSDLYPWLDTIDKGIAPLIREQVANYKREGDNTKRLSVVSNIYLSFVVDKIKPFTDNDYQMSRVDDLINIPKNFRSKAVSELTDRNSILYIWLRRQEIPQSFEMDWGSMDRHGIISRKFCPEISSIYVREK
jgi:serine/threonine protein kinase